MKRIKSFKMFESSTAAATAAIAMKQSLDRLSSHGRKKDANREDDLSKIKDELDQDELDQKYDYDTDEEGMEDVMDEEGMEDVMDEEGMEDVMDEEGIIKTFDELNEAFNKEVVFYKIVDNKHLDSILEEGLFPGPDGGTYTIAEENFNDWLKPNKLFGSLLQALLFFPATRKQKCALLKIKTKPQLVRVRDVSLMLQDMKKWNKSSVYIHDINDTNFEISEYIIMGIVPASKIEVLNKFTAIDDIKKFKINPQSLKDYVFGLSNDLKKVGKISMPRLLLKYFWLKLKLKYF